MTVRVSVSTTSHPRALQRLLRGSEGPVDRLVRTKTDQVATSARGLAPGSMPRGIKTRHGRTRGEISGDVLSTHPATVYVIHGTRPHIIRPVRARALRFTVGGRVVFATLVRHPGTSPNNFLVAALRTVF